MSKVFLGCLLSALLPGQVPLDSDAGLAMHGRIREEGNLRSRVMEYAGELMDGIGPRLTGSPNMTKASEWARGQLAAMGCADARLESWGEFGMGWQQRNVWLRMTEPDASIFIAQAVPWSPATRGPVTAPVISVGINEESHFEQYRGKLAGKIVLFGTPPKATPIDQPLSSRLNEQELVDFARDPLSGAEDPKHYEKAFEMLAFREKIGRFLAAEGALAVMMPSGNNARGGGSGGTIYVDSNYALGWFSYQRAHAMELPVVVVALEHYGRVARLLDRKVPVRLELNVDTQFTGDREEGFNTLAEIHGSDPKLKSEVVMVAAHLDSWAAGTGATDDGAGVVIAMEAMRILNALRVEPKRTIRIALWSGEEQGALGSRAYLKKYIAEMPLAATPEQLRMPDMFRSVAGPVSLKPGHAKLTAIYTLDAGGGRIRGVSLSNNPSLVPIFTRWSEPLRDLEMTMVATRGDCGGDCAAFEQAGIPTPSFKQDPLDYDTRTHHTNMDTYERLQAQDLRQAAIVVATFLYNTAMRDEMLPRLY